MKVTPSHQSILIRRIRELSCFYQCSIQTIDLIEQGLSQPCFKVITKEDIYFVKHLDKGNSETVGQLLAAEYGLAPRVIYFDERWLVTAFIDDLAFKDNRQCKNDKIKSLLSILSRLHQVPLAEYGHSKLPTPINAELILDNLLNRIVKSEHFSHFEEIALQVKKNLNNVTTSDLKHNVVCHGDANFSNVIFSRNTSDNRTDSRAWLIDFECSCLAPIEFELAMLIAINDLGFSYSIKEIISLYSAQYINDMSNHRINNIKPLPVLDTFLVTCYLEYSYLINGLWFLSKFEETREIQYQEQMKCQLKGLAQHVDIAKLIINKMR